MFTFELVTEEYLYIVREIVHSHSDYDEQEYKLPTRTDEELQQFFHHIPGRYTYFIKADDTYIGLLDYTEKGEADKHVRIELLMIHAAYQGYGYGTNAYVLLESNLREKGITYVRVGLLKQDKKAERFWEGLGFVLSSKDQNAKGIAVNYLEKHLL